MSQNTSGILQTISGEIERLAENAGRSVVSVGSNWRNGSGTVWDEHTVVTAYHVVRGMEEVAVGTEDGRKLTAKVAGRLRRSDIAVLSVEAQLTPIQRGDSDRLKTGQFVLALANPFSLQTSVTSGVITSVRRSVGGWWGMAIEDTVITDARVNPGYSGGPLVDASGSLVGINVAYLSGRGVAVPVNVLSQVVQRLAKGQPFKRAFLGIVSSPVALPEEIASHEGVGQETGLMVLAVEDGTPAKQSGLTFGDVILRFGDKRISTSTDLTGLLDEEAIGKPTRLSALRGGKVIVLDVTPGTGPEEQ